MNSKNFKKILSLYNQGVDTHVCVLAILQMELGQSEKGTDQRDAAVAIDKFYHTTAPGLSLSDAEITVIHTACPHCDKPIAVDVPKSDTWAIDALMAHGWTKSAAEEVLGI